MLISQIRHENCHKTIELDNIERMESADWNIQSKSDQSWWRLTIHCECEVLELMLKTKSCIIYSSLSWAWVWRILIEGFGWVRTRAFSEYRNYNFWSAVTGDWYRETRKLAGFTASIPVHSAAASVPGEILKSEFLAVLGYWVNTTNWNTLAHKRDIWKYCVRSLGWPEDQGEAGATVDVHLWNIMRKHGKELIVWRKLLKKISGTHSYRSSSDWSLNWTCT